MKIIINNRTTLPNKYIRLIKWRLYRLKDKFDMLIHAELFLNQEGNKPTEYHTVLKLAIPGHDIILKNKSQNLRQLFFNMNKEAHRYLNKKKQLQF